MSDETAGLQFLDGRDEPDAWPLPHSDGPPSEKSNSTVRIGRWVIHWESIGVAILVVVSAVWFIHLSLKQYYIYGDAPFDLSIFNQGMWLISHFRDPFVTVMGRQLFGDHTSFVLYLFAPFYRLIPEPQGLLVLQSLLLVAPAVPIYLLARKHINKTYVATALVATYLLNPLIQQGNLDQFHPEAFQVLFISLAIYAAIERKSVLLVVMVVLALMVKEDAAVLVIPLGVWVATRRSRLLGLSIVAGSVLWAIIANLLIIPAILGTSSIYTGRIPFGGVSGMLATLFRRPAQLWSYLVSQGRPFYLWQLGSTVGFAFLFSPEIALIGSLVVAENLISNDVYMHQILYQYSIVLAPILVLGTLHAISKQSRAWLQYTMTIVALLAAFATCCLWGYAPFSQNKVYNGAVPLTSIKGLDYLEHELPPNAIVSAWYPIVTHIDERAQVYVWPNPFSAANWGVGNNSGQRLPVAGHVQYLLLPIFWDTPSDAAVFKQISGGYRLIHQRAGFGLYEKIGST